MRPSVLIVDPDEDRRRAISHGLAEQTYEVVPASSAEDGLKFARGLGPSIVVAPAGLAGFGDGSILARFAAQERGAQRTLVLLGERAEEGAELPEEVLYLPTEGLTHHEIVRRLELVLIGRASGLEPDVELRTLVGEVALLPVLELVRALARSAVTGRIELAAGEVMLASGAVVAARAGKARGLKAFCRLARLGHGGFQVHLEPPRHATGETEIDLDLFDLVMKALEDAQVALPDPRARLRVASALLDSAELTTQQRMLLEMVDRCRNVAELLDSLPAPDGRIAEALAKLVERGTVELVPYRAAVTVVTDSTCDLPPELVRAHDLQVVPLSVIFGEHAFRDGVELQPRHFYELLESSELHPRTEPPPPVEFVEHFRSRLPYQDVVAVHVSEKLSQTAANARKAAIETLRTLTDLPAGRENFALEVVDTRSVSLGVGLQALFAARMALRGQKVFAIVQRLKTIVPRVHLLFVVDTLDYLVRGGRVGKAQALVGKILGIKPILGVVDGEVAPVDKVRGGRRAHARIVKLFGERVDPKLPIVAAVAHAKAPVWGARLKELIEKNFQVREMILTDVGPVVGTHAGPGCVGAAIFQPSEEEWKLLGPLGAGEG